MGNEAKPTGGKINERGNKYNTDEGRCNIGTEGLQYKTLKINPPIFEPVNFSIVRNLFSLRQYGDMVAELELQL